jgi:hypothetical protein
MKKLTVIILSLVLLIACSKQQDSLASKEEIAGQAAQQEKVTRVFKGEFRSSIDPDPSNTPLTCSGDIPGFAIPTHFLLNGSTTHLGELIAQQSGFQHTSCNLSISAMQLTTNISGQLTASNGDRIFYTGIDVINVSNLLTGQGTTGGIEGTWTITGGTGRFEEASGSFTINGTVDFVTTTLSFHAEGTVNY